MQTTRTRLFQPAYSLFLRLVRKDPSVVALNSQVPRRGAYLGKLYRSLSENERAALRIRAAALPSFRYRMRQHIVRMARAVDIAESTLSRHWKSTSRKDPAARRIRRVARKLGMRVDGHGLVYSRNAEVGKAIPKISP